METKELFLEPVVRVIKLNANDIIATSNPIVKNEGEDGTLN